MEPTPAMVLAMPPAMLVSAPLLLSISTAWPLLLCPQLLEDMQVLAGMLPTLLELSTWPRGRLKLMLSPTTPPTAILVPWAMQVAWAMPVPIQAMLPMEPMEPTQAMVLAMLLAMLVSAPLLLSTSMASPLLLCLQLLEDMQVLAGMLPTLLELSTWPRG